jgi:transposase InsO family protein
MNVWPLLEGIPLVSYHLKSYHGMMVLQMIILPGGTMATEKMTVDERFKYLRMMQERYHKADRQGKIRLLDESQAVTGLHRKYLIACMNCPCHQRHKPNRARSRTYGPEVEQVVALVADALDWIGADRLQPGLVATAQHLARFGHMTLSAEVLSKLQDVSISTVRRILRRVGRPVNAPPQVRRGRRPDSVVQAQVPVGVIPWDEAEPGHFEADLVLHGTAGLEGPFVCSLQLVDVLTGWSERFAILGHEFDEMWQAIQAFKERCPIRAREIHTDNGSEFINRAFVSQFGPEALNAQLTRGRVGSKNDNRFVEQKNSSLVRAYLGNLYLYTATHRALLDRLYEDMGLYYNLFQPVVRQTARHVEAGDHGLIRIVRTQDCAATPLDRLLRAKPPLARDMAEYLQTLHHDTDPLELKRHIHRQLDELVQLAHRDAALEAICFG